jgi:hypothetical protein
VGVVCTFSSFDKNIFFTIEFFRISLSFADRIFKKEPECTARTTVLRSNSLLPSALRLRGQMRFDSGADDANSYCEGAIKEEEREAKNVAVRSRLPVISLHPPSSRIRSLLERGTVRIQLPMGTNR